MIIIQGQLVGYSPILKANPLLLIIINKQWELINDLLAKNLITKEMLEVCLPEEICSGMNGVWLLLTNEQVNIIKKFAERNLITQKQLERRILTKQGGNESIWRFLIEKQEWNLFKIFITQNLLTKEQMEMVETTGPDQGVNLLWVLAIKRQWDIINTLFDKKLVTSQQLMAHPQKGENTGINVLLILIYELQWDIFDKFLINNLITQEQLEMVETTGPDQGINLLWVLAIKRQWDIINTLFDKKLVTSQQLMAHPQKGENTGINVLLILIYELQWDIFDKFLINNLITQEQLAARAEGENFNGLNTLALIVACDRSKRINVLLRKNLISASQLSTHVCFNIYNIHAEGSIFDVLIKKGCWQVLTKFIVINFSEPNKEIKNLFIPHFNNNLLEFGTTEVKIALGIYAAIHNLSTRFFFNADYKTEKEWGIFLGNVQWLSQSPIQSNKNFVYLPSELLPEILKFNYPNLFGDSNFVRQIGTLYRIIQKLQLDEEIQLFIDKIVKSIYKIKPDFFGRNKVLFFMATTAENTFRTNLTIVLTEIMRNRCLYEIITYNQQLELLRNVVKHFKNANEATVEKLMISVNEAFRETENQVTDDRVSSQRVVS